MFADFGCAPLFVREEHLEWLTPDRTAIARSPRPCRDRRFRLHETARKYEHANVSYGSVTAMNAALDVLAGVGLEAIEKHTVELAGQLRSEIADLGLELFTPPDNPSPIVSFYHGLDLDDLYDGLAAEKVPITFQEQGRLVRSAVAMFNNRDDIDRLIKVLAALV